MTPDETTREAAWWSAVAEPADPAARVLRATLGDRRGRQWLQAEWSGVPRELRGTGEARWDQQWNRWRERALTVDVERELARVERAGGGCIAVGGTRVDRWGARLDVRRGQVRAEHGLPPRALGVRDRLWRGHRH